MVTSNGVINAIGNNGWYIRGKHRALGDEQAIDVGALVEAFLDAYRITGKRQYYQNALECFSWFTGTICSSCPFMMMVQAVVLMVSRLKKELIKPRC